MVDIFNAVKEKVMPTWAKFTNPGDGFQGTYVGKITGQKDGYGNEQIIYQLLQEDGTVVNVGFGLNKKFLHQDLKDAKFGQIIGFRYKGTIQVKNKLGKMVDVKDYAVHQDPKIVDEKWLKEHKDDMPTVTHVASSDASGDEHFDNLPDAGSTEDSDENDVPFSSEGSLTNEDKLAVIAKLATDKLGATDEGSVKAVVMEKTGIAFIPVNYDKILDALKAL